MMLVRAVAIAGSLAALAIVAHAQSQPAPPPAVVQNVTGNSNTNIGVINGQVTINGLDPAVLAAMAKTFANEMAATTAAKAQAEARAAELATKLGFTSAAVSEFFRIVAREDVPAEKVPERLVEIATHFAQTRDALAAIEPDDPHPELVGSATQALEAGRLSEADQLLDQAKDFELAALREAQELRKRAQEAGDRHALSAAKMLASRGDIARTQLRYKEAAGHFAQTFTLVRRSGRADLAEMVVSARSAVADYYTSVCRNNQDEVNALLAQRR